MLLNTLQQKFFLTKKMKLNSKSNVDFKNYVLELRRNCSDIWRQDLQNKENPPLI